MDSGPGFFAPIFSHLSDPVFIHLRVNHFPIILGMVGMAGVLLALLLQKESVWKYALVTLVLAAASAPVAYYSGKGAEEKAEEHTNIDAGAMEDHEDTATAAVWSLLACGVAAGVCLVKPNAVTKSVVIVLALAGTTLTMRTSAIAGTIVHNPLTVGAEEESSGGGASHEGDDHK